MIFLNILFEIKYFQQQGADTWFPGYTWRICACPHCGQHLGWTFQSTDKNSEHEKDHVHSFHGLILSNVLGENCKLFNKFK